MRSNGPLRTAWHVVLVVGTIFPATKAAAASPESTEAWSPHALIELLVVDAESGEPLSGAQAIAGTSFSSSRGWNWQDHTLFDAEGSVVRWPQGNKQGYRLQVIRVEVPGYIPYEAPPFGLVDSERLPKDALHIVGGEPVRLEARLTRDPMTPVKLLQPDGQPAAGGQVAIAMNQRPVRIAEGRLHKRELPDRPTRGDRWEQPVMTTTDDSGGFRLPVEVAHRAVVVAAHESGFVVVPAEEFRGTTELRLEPWGTIHGQAILANKPAEDLRLRILFRTRLLIDDYLYQRVTATTDQEGRFVVEHATPGLTHFSTIPERSKAMAPLPRTSGTVAAGGITAFVYGGVGRPVVGRVVGFDKHDDLIVTCELPGPSWKDGGKHNQYFSNFMKSDAGNTYRIASVPVAPDGTFRFENVSPEYYQLDVWRIKADGARERVTVRRKFQVMMLPSNQSDEPFNVGDIKRYPPR